MKYSQLAKFKEIGEKGQKILESKTVTIVGLGNLGSTISVMLLRSGVGLRIIDKGRVDVAELSAQSIYLAEDHQKFKAKQAKKRLDDIDATVKVRTFHEDLTKNNIYLAESDLIIDVTGNMETTDLLSELAKKKKIPFVFAVASGSQGLVFGTVKSTNITKLKQAISKMKTVEEAGVISPAVFLASALVVRNVFKLLLGKPSKGEAVIFDIWNDSFKKIKI